MMVLGSSFYFFRERGFIFYEVEVCIWLDVFTYDGDMAVSVWSCVFVLEVNDVI